MSHDYSVISLALNNIFCPKKLSIQRVYIAVARFDSRQQSNGFQPVKVKDTYSSTKVKSGVSQGSLLGVILFNIQFNDIFDIIDEAELYFTMLMTITFQL